MQWRRGDWFVQLAGPGATHMLLRTLSRNLAESREMADHAGRFHVTAPAAMVVRAAAADIFTADPATLAHRGTCASNASSSTTRRPVIRVG